MPSLTITKNDIREIVTESVRDTLSSEFMKFRALVLPLVSLKEQKEIEKLLNKSDRSVGKKVRIFI